MHRSFVLPAFLTILVSSAAIAQSATAQSAAEHIKMGDKAYAAVNDSAAFTQYVAAVDADGKNAEALGKASLVAIELGEFDYTHQDSLYQLGESYAERAVAAAPQSADARFALVQALGRIALSVSQIQRVKYANKIYDEANECVKLDPKQAGCWHALGVWNAEVMRLSGFERSMAIHSFGGTSLKNATWEDAQKDLEKAVALEPNRAISHLELGRVFRDMGDTAKAKAQFEAVLKAPSIEYNDKHYKESAKESLQMMGAS